MKQIEIDLDVHRCIENARSDFNESENNILRRLLGIERVYKSSIDSKVSLPFLTLDDETKAANEVSEISEKISAYQTRAMSHRIADVNAVVVRNWVYGGASLPEGTKLQKWSRKQKYEAVIHNGSIYVNGEYHQSPSSAAMAVNGGTSVNGWNFWEYFNEETKRWQKISLLREQSDVDDEFFEKLSETNPDNMNADARFINELPFELTQLGKQFLLRIRQFHNGKLIYHPMSQKYVETPNFYTVKIQPKDKSLRVTIYGNPEEFNNTLIQLAPDMAGYSAFKLNNSGQLDAAISLVNQAKELKNRIRK